MEARDIVNKLHLTAKAYGEKESPEIEKMIGEAFSNGILTSEGSLKIDLAFLQPVLMLAFMAGVEAALVEITAVQDAKDEAETKAALEQTLLNAEGSTKTGAAV